MTLKRREVMGTLFAAGLAGLRLPSVAAEPGKLSDGDYKRLSAAPKTPADHTALAKHYRAIAAEHQAEAKAFDGLAAAYSKGVPGLSASRGRELTRAAKHIAGHTRDFIEALTEIAEVHEGIAQGPL